jgi:hypothetical protein
MPDSHGVAFPPRVDIEAKLDMLEEEREYLLKMCPSELRDTYEDGKEETLIRLLVRHLPAEYDAAVKTVKDLARLRKYSEEGNLETITNCEDNTRANYAVDYLSDYVELRFELIRTYQLAERRREEMNKKGAKKGHPSFPIMDGHAQPGAAMMSCYRCGVKGHRAGDPSCKGKEGEVHKDAPEWFRKQNGARARGGKGKGKGKGKKGGKGNRNAKPLCHNWSKGNGYCRYAAASNFSHDGPQGGDKRKGEKGSTTLPTKAVKRPKKEIMAMVIEGMKGEGETVKPKGSKAEQASNTLLALVRSEKKTETASMLSVDLKKDSTDFVPSRKKPEGETVLMIPSPWSKAQEFRPVRRSSVEDKGASNKESGFVSSEVEKDMTQTENGEEEKRNLTKTNPLSIKKRKGDTFKRAQRQNEDFLCEEDCFFRGKEFSLEPGVLGLESGEAADSDDLEAERRAEKKIDSWNALARERQAQDEAQRKTARIPNPNGKLDSNKVCLPIPPPGFPDERMSERNQVRITLTTIRDAEGRITGTSSSRTMTVPAVEPGPPDLTPLMNGDEEYILVKVSKVKRRCWVTYLNGGNPETEREFYIGTTVAGLLAPEHADSR